MKYYKIVSNSTFIGVINSNNFCVQNPYNGWMLNANEEEGQFVLFNNQLYRDYWMRGINANSSIAFIIANIIEINENEYNVYKEAMDKNENIPVEPIVQPQVDIIDINEEKDTISIEFIRSSKLNEMSYACRTTIEGGFDLELRGIVKHFSLDTQDQLNLITLSAMAQTQTLIPYHADGEECVFYTNEEINEIVETANAFKIYHTTYYNALKTYINALETIEEISAITYGVEIPDEYKSDVLKVLEQ